MMYRKEDFPNFLDSIGFGYKEFIKMLSLFPRYTSPPKVDRNNPVPEVEAVENWSCQCGSCMMPRFVDVFYNMLFSEHKLPSAEGFANGYMALEREKIFDFINDKVRCGGDKDLLMSAIRNRCIRTYPSLVRDLGFGLLLKDLYGMSVVYNTTLDVNMETDLMYTGPSGINYGIHLYTSTPRAKSFRAVKDRRHQNLFDNVIPVDLEIDLSRPGRTSVNGIMLYDEQDANFLFLKMGKAKEATEYLRQQNDCINTKINEGQSY